MNSHVSIFARMYVNVMLGQHPTLINRPHSCIEHCAQSMPNWRGGWSKTFYFKLLVRTFSRAPWLLKKRIPGIHKGSLIHVGASHRPISLHNSNTNKGYNYCEPHQAPNTGCPPDALPLILRDISTVIINYFAIGLKKGIKEIINLEPYPLGIRILCASVLT